MPDYPKRKQIRLENYDYSLNNAYFLTICTYERQKLFGNINLSTVGADPCVRPSEMHIIPENAYFLAEKWIFKIEEKFPDYIVDSYVIMPDHIHLLIVKCNLAGGHMGPPLQDVVRWFKTQMLNEYIRGVKENKYLPYNKKFWQRSYFDHIIRNKQDMQETRRYIYENPLKIIGNMYGL